VRKHHPRLAVTRPDRTADRRDALTADDDRDRLPALRAWLDDDTMKHLTRWRGPHLTRDEAYFDRTNPTRGPFLATGAAGPVTERTSVARTQLTVRAWTQRSTWHQPIAADQGGALAAQEHALGLGREQRAAGEAHPLPPHDGPRVARGPS